MITVEEAQKLVLSLAHPARVETVPLAAARGRVLAEPVTARLTQPPFDSSAMDGYAVRSADLPGPLRVIGTAAAGNPWQGEAEPGTAVRIFTGAPVPAGFDRVVIQENVARDGDTITVTTPSDNLNIRKQGNDFSEGSAFFPRRPLTASDIGLIAAMNLPEVAVAARPRVFIIAGGDELVPPGTTPKSGQIISSNDLAIAALAEEAGADVTILPIARDTEDSLRDRFQAARDGDLIVTIGGASVGDHDLVGKVAAELGMERAFYKLAMRPGKPLMAGKIDQAAMLGLPGNPVSSIVCAKLFMQHLITRMQGLDGALRPRKARLGTDLPPEGDRQHYLRATLSEGEDLPEIAPFPDQDSARLKLLADADALLIRPAHDRPRKAGEVVDFIPLR